MPLLGAIADDFTGATDLALTLARGGMSVKQIVGVPANVNSLMGAQAIVVSLKSRTAPAAEAVLRQDAISAGPTLEYGSVRD